MHEIQQIGYFPGYSGDPRYRFSKKYTQRVAVSFDCVETDPDADYRVLVQCEPPKLYIAFAGMVYNAYKNFDLILTYDDRLLQLPNAREFIPVGSWLDDIEIAKTDQISYLMSSKIMTHEHRMRFQLLRDLEKANTLGQFDFFMHRSPPRVDSKNAFFTNAKFHIACENQVMTNMFTEKLLDCFKTYTVPIYYGCTNIGKYFNPKGILAFNTIEEFRHIANTITPDTYQEMLPFVKENHELGKPYWENNVYQRLESTLEKQLNLVLAQ